ncbi:SH3 domain-containing protein [Mameliella alba]|uniref:SH3 domain-containing protein n=1 Tax=Mameliella alba TaxID=561184 RepID=UPI000881A3AF|nr:SH3 domain-containing protein [Mameliella alba]MBY6119703.1 SH3 domain-containing protein [Mameliella alba]OWV45562.1 SH3 domain-containing protein [Mameliella alba]OWV49940.1 SH3 domain-containing protein [Mameliella alba]OWV65693.1 SH3 domain-containing protein [Mameliella alba]PTR42688.1 SH3 domain-containing protein [Mameliella alba]
MKKLILSAIIAATAMTASAASATQAWIGNNHLNARSGPGVQYHKLGVFKPCTPVHVVKFTRDYYGNPTWYKVYFNHNYYWVKADYVQGHACHWTPKKQHWGHKKQHWGHKNHYYNY